jgi:NADPH:quinone reductase-like Zn-dependent oxidoreductase
MSRERSPSRLANDESVDRVTVDSTNSVRVMNVKRILKKALKWTSIVIGVVLFLGVAALFVGYWRSTNECGRNAATLVNPMKAIVYCDFGPADVLRLESIEKPVPNDNQVLIKVHAASVNPFDWHFMRGIPYVMRLEAGLRKPKNIRLGGDVAGTVETTGKNVTQFKPGDEVFGVCAGAFAEYCLSKSRLALKPENITFEQAASVPVAALTALQALRNKGNVQAGQKVLINGASGGVGTFAVQIAKSFGATVTGVCSGRNVEMVRALGADRVIDYTKDDFSKGAERYDLIIDNVGTQPLSGFRRVLTASGTCVMIGGGGPDEGKWIGPMGRPLKALLLSPFISQKMGMMMAEITKDDLVVLRDLIQAGKVTPAIDRTYQGLSQVPQAIRYLEEGHARGKVVIALE